MSKSYIPKALREHIAAQAKYRCGYCLTAEDISGMPMEIDHLMPESLYGPTEEDNLWLACSQCNKHKSHRITAIDSQTDEMVLLFNPRAQDWNEHFAWTEDGEQIIGLTAIGRATVGALNLNRPTLVKARRRWVEAGWHPPKD